MVWRWYYRWRYRRQERRRVHRRLSGRQRSPRRFALFTRGVFQRAAFGKYDARRRRRYWLRWLWLAPLVALLWLAWLSLPGLRFFQ